MESEVLITPPDPMTAPSRPFPHHSVIQLLLPAKANGSQHPFYHFLHLCSKLACFGWYSILFNESLTNRALPKLGGDTRRKHTTVFKALG